MPKVLQPVGESYPDLLSPEIIRHLLAQRAMSRIVTPTRLMILRLQELKTERLPFRDSDQANL